jgi:hypothetical protein
MLRHPLWRRRGQVARVVTRSGHEVDEGLRVTAMSGPNAGRAGFIIYIERYARSVTVLLDHGRFVRLRAGELDPEFA